MDWRLLKERLWPYFFTAVGLAGSFFIPAVLQRSVEKDLANAVVTILAILTAFTATSMTIILTADDKVPGIKLLRAHPNSYRYFIDYHTESIVWAVISCFLSLGLIFVAQTPDNEWHRLAFSIWFGVVIAAITLFLRVVFLLRKLLLQI